MSPGRRSTRSNPALAGFVLCAALLLAGCAAPPMAGQLAAQWPTGLPAQALLADTPFIDQADYECGPAALAMLLQGAAQPVTAEQLRPQVYLPGRQGSLQQELLVAARRQGMLGYRLAPTLEALLREVAAGHPVLVFQNLSLPAFPVWHYAVLIGFDRRRGELLLHSGHTPRQPISLATFERTWERGGHWAMVALPPSQLPATAEAAPVASALAALERVKPAAAREGYRSALLRWPTHPALLLGAGNAAYALGDLPAAASAYEAGARAHPQLADAWNNLAQVLMELGRKNEARSALQRALDIGGPRLPVYRELELQLNKP